MDKNHRRYVDCLCINHLKNMLGGSNSNSLIPVFVDENLFQYPSNTSNQLQLFGNVACNVDQVNYSARDQNSPVFRPNKRPRETEANNLMQKKLQISLNHSFYNEDINPPSTIPNPHHVSTGLKLSYDDEERNSSITSASASMTLAPSIMSSFGDSITTELDRHKDEFERYIMIQEENMLKGMRDIRQRHMASFLAAIEKGVANKVREKEHEIQTINRKNKELVERIKHVANEAQNWHYRAKYNESMVNILKTNLHQALAQGNDNQIKEGFGDTDLENDNDAVSSMDPKNHTTTTCKACRTKEVSVLVMPCRHLSLCKDCDSFTSVCPVCQVVKTVSVEVYLS
ncbi:BOI-related E3 ubiquitin-protein ligase 1 isoform X2 [Lactuca sativa]|uniref:RING-type domain-containing protein n=1 Tax=Lactuca sativa TaxID=4236 RepID=A0A9R1XJW2_LACSA|nr:BOI-related E3 ubiquitin-protein ligase 1 isoform X2 [Lactuca sativa]KAJ0217420.1 hypothetical protein LSAT_V11C300112380 [Lactuca sativa]